MMTVKHFANYQVDTYFDDNGNKSFIEIVCDDVHTFLEQVLNVFANHDDIFNIDVDDGYDEYAESYKVDEAGNYYDFNVYDCYDLTNISINFKTTKIPDIWVKLSRDVDVDEINKISDIVLNFIEAFENAKTNNEKINVVIDYIYKI